MVWYSSANQLRSLSGWPLVIWVLRLQIDKTTSADRRRPQLLPFVLE